MTGIYRKVFLRAFCSLWGCGNHRRIDGDMAEWSLWYYQYLLDNLVSRPSFVPTVIIALYPSNRRECSGLTLTQSSKCRISRGIKPGWRPRWKPHTLCTICPCLVYKCLLVLGSISVHVVYLVYGQDNSWQSMWWNHSSIWRGLCPMLWDSS